jgi:hypothetical protein
VKLGPPQPILRPTPEFATGPWAEPFRLMGCTAGSAECVVHLVRLLPRSSIMRRLLSTAKTTLLPANHSLDTKKGLHSNERLDDSLDPQQTSAKEAHQYQDVIEMLGRNRPAHSERGPLCMGLHQFTCLAMPARTRVSVVSSGRSARSTGWSRGFSKPVPVYEGLPCLGLRRQPRPTCR